MEATQEIVYQVEATLGKDVNVNDYGSWLHEHVDEMLRTLKGSTSAEIATAEGEEGAPVTFVISYRVSSRENLQDYFDNHAAKLRAVGIEKWSSNVTYARKILHVKSVQKPKPQGPVFGYVH